MLHIYHATDEIWNLVKSPILFPHKHSHFHPPNYSKISPKDVKPIKMQGFVRFSEGTNKQTDTKTEHNTKEQEHKDLMKYLSIPPSKHVSYH